MKFDRIISDLITVRATKLNSAKTLKKTYPDQIWDFLDRDIKNIEEAIDLLEKHNDA